MAEYQNTLEFDVSPAPVLSWTEGEIADFRNSDVMSGGSISQVTQAINFTTGTDVLGLQVLYEQGGASSGLNIYIEDGQLFAAVWDVNDGGWGVVELSADIAGETQYEVALILDATVADGGLVALVLNGVQVDAASGVNAIRSLADSIGLGEVSGKTRIDGAAITDDATFGGTIHWVEQIHAVPSAASYSGTPEVEGHDALIASLSDAALIFEWQDGDDATIESSEALNGGLFDEKTQIVSFTTGDNIDDLQMLYEQGGRTRGLNLFIEGGTLYAAVWNGAKDAWDYTELSAAVEANTSYDAVLVMDGNAEQTGTASLYLNGALVDEAGGIGVLRSQTGDGAVGHVDGNTLVHDQRVGDDASFTGTISYVAGYNDAADPEGDTGGGFEEPPVEEPPVEEPPVEEPPVDGGDDETPPDPEEGGSDGWAFQGISLDYARNGLAVLAESQLAMDGVVEINANAVAIVSRYQVAHQWASDVYADDYYTESLANITQAIQDAQARGLQILLKPHLGGADGTWSGNLTPNDADAFFESYKAHILDLARIAEANDVEVFSLGNEMGELYGPEYTDYWLDIITDVRDIYSGDVTIAAQYWQAGNIEFWDELDFIGINGYFPLSDAPVPTVEKLIAAWTTMDSGLAQWLGMSVVDYTQSLSEQYDLPVIFTEIGFRSIEGAASDPGDYDLVGEVSEEAQANMMEAFMQVWGEQGDWFEGSFLWGWNVAQGQDNDYSVQDRLAEEIVADAYGAQDGILLPEDEGGQTEITLRVSGKGPEDFTPELLVNLDGLDVALLDVTAVRAEGDFQEFTITVDDASPEELRLFFTNPVDQTGIYVDWIDVNGLHIEGEDATDNAAIPEGYQDNSEFASLFMNGALSFSLVDSELLLL